MFCVVVYNFNIVYCIDLWIKCVDFWIAYRQELSYRQQIACKLRTQYAEGIYIGLGINITPWPLKSRLRVIQGHWKQNHWIDHTRLSSSRVIWRLILLWHWNVVPFESLGTVSYSPSIVAMAVCLAISEIFSVKEWHDLENQVRARSRSLKMALFDKPYATSIGRPL